MATPEVIEHVRHGLRSWSNHKRQATANYVKQLPHTDAVSIAVALYEESCIRKKRTLCLSDEYVASLAIGALIGAFVAWAMGAVSFGIALAIASGLLLVFAMFCSFGQNELVPLLTICQIGLTPDGRLGAPLLHCFSQIDSSLRKSLLDPLAKSLSLLDQKEFAELEPEGRATMLRLLSVSHSPVQRAILDVISRGTDISAISQVERLVRRHPDPFVRQTAQTCFTHLMKLRDTQQIGADLLRPSQSDPVPDTLLRVAAPADKSDERQLMRPSNG